MITWWFGDFDADTPWRILGFQSGLGPQKGASVVRVYNLVIDAAAKSSSMLPVECSHDVSVLGRAKKNHHEIMFIYFRPVKNLVYADCFVFFKPLWWMQLMCVLVISK